MSKRLASFASPKPVQAPSRAPVNDSAARAFVGGEEARESRKRRAGPGERIGAYLPPELVDGLRRVALDQRRSVSDALTEAVREWLERQSEKGIQR